MSPNLIRNVAIVGAAGQQGQHIVEELLKGGKHTVTAITRDNSSATPAPGINIAKVNYGDHASLVSALRGQDALIITMAVTAPPDTSEKLVRAAAEAKVPWILPNEWGIDGTNEKLGEECMLGPPAKAIRNLIEKLRVSSWIAVACGFWYEYSLGGSKDRYGFDFQKKEVTFYDDGNTKINTSTWVQVARAVTAILSMDASALQANLQNKYAYVKSFHVSQKDIFERVKVVTGTNDDDWKIDYQPSSERFVEGRDEMYAGNRAAFAKMLYARCLYPNGELDIESKHGLANEMLGLPIEDLDEYTKAAIKISDETAKEAN